MPRSANAQSRLTPAVKAVEEALVGISTGEQMDNHEEALYDALDRGLRTAISMARQSRTGSRWTQPPEMSFSAVIAANLRSLRLDAAWTQQQLAEAMAAAGFRWTRETVVEVERKAVEDPEAENRGRRVQLEELLVLAALFGVPVLELLIPDQETVLGMPNTSLDRDDVISLFVGRGGILGSGGPAWSAPMSVFKENDFERPAKELWRARRVGDSSGGPS